MEHSKKGDRKVHLNEQIPSLFTDNGKVNDPETVANAFKIFS
jgi:hypothetical protein